MAITLSSKDLTDNVGKGTLITNIIKHFKLPFQHIHYYGPPCKDKEKDIAFDMKLYQDMCFIFNHCEHVIADRSHLGSLVYSPLYRGHDGKHVMGLEKHLPEDTVLITLIDDAENVITRDDGLSFSTNIDKKKDEIQSFIEAHTISTIKHKLLINVKDYNAEQLIDHVVKYLSK